MLPLAGIRAGIRMVLAGLVVASSAHAVVFDVTKTEDTADGACDADCSLREAIVAANAAPDGPHVVMVPVGLYKLTIPPTAIGTPTPEAGSLEINASMDIVGAGRDATIVEGVDDGMDANRDRVFQVNNVGASGIRVRFKHLTIAKGYAQYGRGLGFFARSGGAINADSDVTLGIFDCLIEKNVALDDGGGVSFSGRRLTMIDATVLDNQVGNVGGGVAHFAGFFEPGMIRRSVVRGNTGPYRGVGVLNSGLLRIEDSLIAENTSATLSGEGGGLFTSNSLTVVRNSTLSGNVAYSGGAFLTVGSSSVFTNVTVANNDDTAGGDGLYYAVSAPSAFANNLLAGDGCFAPNGVPLPVTTGGGNVEDGDTCGLGAQDDPDVPDAGLAPLADNGGDSETHALLPGSPATGFGVPEACPFVDQRGFIRDDGECDSGAHEAGASVPACGTQAENEARLEMGVGGVSADPVGTMEVCLQELAGYP